MPNNSPIPEGKLQPIRNFTAQVRRGEKQVVGTAFVVGQSPPRLVTCRHVVKASAGTCDKDTEVTIYFPQLSDNSNKSFTAKVESLPDSSDDVAILKLDMEYLPAGVEVATIGRAEDSVGYADPHKFRSFGFRKLSKYRGLPATGEIIDFTAQAEDGTFLVDPLMLTSQNIDSGMSGSAVLDLSRNLVVGVISQTWDSDGESADRDTCFAVDCKVFSIEPLNLDIYEGYQLPTTPVDMTPPEQAQQKAQESHLPFPLTPIYQPTKPPELPEWAGRADMLTKLDKDYADPTVHLTGLIGFGGEGKSSIAYRWVTKHLLSGEYDLPDADAVFWWSFYEERSIDKMLEALTAYLYGEDQLQKISGVAERVNHIGALVITNRIVLILDGLEVIQEESGDKYGTMSRPEMKDLLEMFTRQGHNSFCLVTSRVPLLDFLSHTAYVQRDVTRLSVEDGRELLQNLELSGDDDALDRIVKDWEGHALTVSLVGTYLREQDKSADDYNMDIFPEVEAFEDELPRYRRVRRVLQRYDSALTDADKAFLKIFSVFRLPVAETAFNKVFRLITSSNLNLPLIALHDEPFWALVQGLIDRRLIRKTEGEKTTYSAHPLVQVHYRRMLEADHRDDDTVPVHRTVASHYYNTADYKIPSKLRIQVGLATTPSLDDLKPYIEVVHHLCQAGAYDEAFDVYQTNLYQGQSFVLTQKLGAYETAYKTWLIFFPDGNINVEPQVNNDRTKRFILNDVGLCLTILGLTRDAIAFMERKNAIALRMDDHHNAGAGYQNLAEIYLYLGELDSMKQSLEQALEQAQLVVDERQRKQAKIDINCYLGLVYHLLGNVTKSSEIYEQAEHLQREIIATLQYHYSIDGIRHADHLRRTDQADYARAVTDANLDICQRAGWTHRVSQCYRVLGDLDADAGNHTSAGEHYEQAIILAGQIDQVYIKVEAWLARGRWYAKHMNNSTSAFVDLEQALALAQNAEYRIYEADIRVALAWAHKANGDNDRARQEAYIAKGMSEDMGYYWGKVDADDILGRL